MESTIRCASVKTSADLKEGFPISVTASQEAVKADDGHFADGAGDPTAAPHHVVLQAVRDEGHHMRRPVRR